MKPIILSELERERFASYLESDAASDQEMANQLEKLSIHPAAPHPLARKLRAEAAASTIIAAKLRAIESQVTK